MLLVIAISSALAGPVPMFGHGSPSPVADDRSNSAPTMRPYGWFPAGVVVIPAAPTAAAEPKRPAPPQPTEWQLKTSIAEGGELVAIDALPTVGTVLEWSDDLGQPE